MRTISNHYRPRVGQQRVSHVEANDVNGSYKKSVERNKERYDQLKSEHEKNHAIAEAIIEREKKRYTEESVKKAASSYSDFADLKEVRDRMEEREQNIIANYHSKQRIHVWNGWLNVSMADWKNYAPDFRNECGKTYDEYVEMFNCYV